ncbi:MAG: UDP-2,3-diacylglucosamine diphosphatase LpxI [Hyphomicrobiales bacterium]|nr:UDP-2,3-diacylglucosamine diphosphatase LpxI [Hyphomicrobiales bacterium]
MTPAKLDTDAGGRDGQSAAGAIAIIAGSGPMPKRVADAAQRAGRRVFVVGIVGIADQTIEAFPHAWLKWGEVGRLFKLIDAHDVTEIVMIGAIDKRPNLSEVRFDLGAVSSLPEILSLVIGGDDKVLTGVVKFAEKRGLKIVGAHEVAPELVAPVGPLGRRAPQQGEVRDIALAVDAVLTLGRLDIGQAAVAVDRRVIAVEGAEGTDAMLERVAELHNSGRVRWRGRAGVLAKCPKPQQDLRVDMPAIGVRTVEKVAAAGLAGIAVEAGRVLVGDRMATANAADAAGIFIVGVDPAVQAEP